MYNAFSHNDLESLQVVSWMHLVCMFKKRMAEDRSWRRVRIESALYTDVHLGCDPVLVDASHTMAVSY